MSALTDLQNAVQRNTEAIAAAVAKHAQDAQTIADLTAQVEALKSQVTDDAALAALTSQLVADDSTLV